jgi:hypothetical protein
MAGKPAGYTGTVNNQYKGESATPRGGTPYTSRDGNPPGAKRVASHGAKMGEVIDTATGENFSNPLSNGVGVVLGQITREADYFPQPAGVMDSPVPNGAPTFRAGSMRAENVAHLGQGIGAAPSQASDEILKIGGVMSRGMEEGDLGGEKSELVENKG